MKFRKGAALFLMGTMVCCFVSCSKNTRPDRNDHSSHVEELQVLTMRDAFRFLNSADLTLEDILAIERRDISGSKEEKEELNRRLIAFKHLYVEGFCPNTHLLKDLKGILLLQGSYFSDEQQDYIKWFYTQPDYVQKNWERCGSVNSFVEFKREIEKISNIK